MFKDNPSHPTKEENKEATRQSSVSRDKTGYAATGTRLRKKAKRQEGKKARRQKGKEGKKAREGDVGSTVSAAVDGRGGWSATLVDEVRVVARCTVALARRQIVKFLIFTPQSTVTVATRVDFCTTRGLFALQQSVFRVVECWGVVLCGVVWVCGFM